MEEGFRWSTVDIGSAGFATDTVKCNDLGDTNAPNNVLHICLRLPIVQRKVSRLCICDRSLRAAKCS